MREILRGIAGEAEEGAGGLELQRLEAEAVLGEGLPVGVLPEPEQQPLGDELAHNERTGA
jgi:hypothetical protein